MKISLHIGATKTGSSALQAHLFEARPVLARHGICYPDVGIAANAHHVLFAAAHPSAWGLHKDLLPDTVEARHEKFRELFQASVAEAEAAGAQRMILSSEYLWGLLPDVPKRLIAQATRGFEVDLVCALRRQDDWLVASYLQAVRSGLPLDFEAWLDRARKSPLTGARFDNVLRVWINALQPASVRVKLYTPETRAGILAEMITALCDAPIAEEVLDGGQKVINASPSVAQLDELLTRNRNGTAPAAQDADSAEHPGARLPGPRRRARLLEVFGSGNRTLGEELSIALPPDWVPDER